MVKGIGIVLGGPPNSGKSSFSVLLTRALQDMQVDAYSADLDLWSPTIDFLEGKISDTERQKRKRSNISLTDARNATKEFKNLLNEHLIVIGDAPGGISKESKLILKKAKYGIILCRDDQSNKINEWKGFFNDIGIIILAVIISKLKGEENVIQNDIIKAELVNLNREDLTVTSTIKAIAVMLRSKLRI